AINTVKIKKSITITPLVNDATDPVYTWKDEKGKIVSTDLSYTYSPKAEGEVNYKFRVDAKNGYAEQELRVDV
ncbi:PKD-like domain-containing protein, partial [Bacteroides thetaiotaomicron]|uniref:PKD-like domain-containing protein n=1 Tax=Bacteroides thetaiotaomicron TaxID=818 RepID=UPI00273041FA